MTPGLSWACAGVRGHRDPGPLAEEMAWRLGQGAGVDGDSGVQCMGTLGPGASVLNRRGGREALADLALVAGGAGLPRSRTGF